MTRVGVIGVGGMGACHARHVAELSGATLGWVADPDESSGRAEGIQDKFICFRCLERFRRESSNL